MSKTVSIQATAGGGGVVACLYEKAFGGRKGDTLLEAHFLPSLADVAQLAVSATRYVVVCDPSDETVKSIDNWNTSPPPDPTA